MAFFESLLPFGVLLYLHEVAVLLVGLAELVLLVLDELVAAGEVAFQAQILECQIDQVMLLLNLHPLHF